MTYSCETTDKGTAEITCIVAGDGVTAVSVPSSIEHGGQTYKVTDLYFSSGIVAENVEQLTLPDTLENVRGWYFRKFVKVKELHIPGSIKNFGCSLQNAGSLEKLYFDEGVEEISANMMVNGCSSLSEINLPSTLKMISGSGAFEGGYGPHKHRVSKRCRLLRHHNGRIRRLHVSDKRVVARFGYQDPLAHV